MTNKRAKEMIEHLKSVAGDEEVAHSYEDSMYEEFIDDMAKKGNRAAKTLLKSKDVEFARWYA